MSTLSSQLAKLERLKKLQLAAVELEIEMKSDLLRFHLENGPVAKSKLRLNFDPARLSVRAAIIKVLGENAGPVGVAEIASKVCQLLPDRNPKKVVGQVSVALSSYCGSLFEKVSRGTYKLADRTDLESE